MDRPRGNLRQGSQNKPPQMHARVGDFKTRAEAEDSVMRYDSDIFRNFYAAMGQQHPNWLDDPIAGPPPEHTRGIFGYVSVPPEAVDQTPHGWETSGFVEVAGSTGSMQRASNLVARLRFER